MTFSVHKRLPMVRWAGRLCRKSKPNTRSYSPAEQTAVRGPTGGGKPPITGLNGNP